MTQPVLRVNLSSDAKLFRPSALQPGLLLAERNGVHAGILHKWVGGRIAYPTWTGSILEFRVQNEAKELYTPVDFQPISRADCRGRFRPQFAELQNALDTAPAKSGTEHALRIKMSRLLKTLTSTPQTTAEAGVFFKARQPDGSWHLVWCFGYERQSSSPSTPGICANSDCRSLGLLESQRQNCPACGKMMKRRGSSSLGSKSLALLLLMVGIAAGAFWYWQQPRSNALELEGQVLSSLGKTPISEALVRIEGTDLKTNTDKEGRFHFAGLPAESITVVVEAKGYHTESQAANLAQSPGQRFLVKLRGNAVLHGTVVNDFDKTPIAGAVLRISSSGQEVLSDERGRFHFREIPGGPIEVLATADGFQSQNLKTALPESGKEGDGSSLRFLLKGSGTILGTVVDAVSLKPVAKARAFVLNTSLSTQTDEQGTFRFTGLPAGQTSIAVQKEGYKPENLDQKLSGSETAHVRLGLYGSHGLFGHIRCFADDRPLAGCAVKLSDFNLTAQSDASGGFEFPTLPPGKVKVHVSLPGYKDWNQELSIGQTSERVKVGLIGNAVLKGMVRDVVNKKPLPNVEVRIAKTNLKVKTQADGTFQLEGIPLGSATIQVVGAGYREAEVAREFESGRETTLTFDLKGGTIFSGRIQEAKTNAPIPNARVELAGTKREGKTDREGRFRFEDIVAGPAQVQVTAAGYRPSVTKTELKAEKEITLEISLTGDGLLTGTVVHIKGKSPIENVKVELKGTSHQAKTDQKGVFRLEGVPSGEVEMQVTAAGYQSASLLQTILPAQETQLNMSLTGDADLTGLVFNAAGKPIPNTLVRMFKAGAMKRRPAARADFALKNSRPAKPRSPFGPKGISPKSAQSNSRERSPHRSARSNCRPSI